MKKSNGYTLLEMLIVLMLVAIILPTIFSIISVLLIQQIKIYRLAETKRQGDRIVSFMRDKITHEGVQIRDNGGGLRCNTFTGVVQTSNTGDDFVFWKGTTATDPRFNFFMNGQTLWVSDPTVMPNTALHDGTVRVTNFQIECYRRNNLFNPLQPGNQGVVLIGVSFNVEFIDNSPSAQEGNTILQYQTRILMR